MPSTTYVDFSQPAVGATWLNEVNDYVFDNSATDPSGGRRAAIDEDLQQLGYSAFVDYAAGLSMVSVAQTVLYQGIPYYPKLADLPFTTSGAFEAAKFAQVYGVSRYALAASDGSSLVGYLGSGTGAIATTVQTQLREIAIFASRFGVTGVAGQNQRAAMQAALDAIPVTGGTLILPRGTITLDATQLTMLGKSNVTIQGYGMGATIIDGAAVTGGTPNSVMVLGYMSGAPSGGGLENVTLRDFSICGSGTVATGNIINYRGINNITFERLEVYHGYREGIYCDGPTNSFSGLTVKDCYFHDCFAATSNGVNTNTLGVSNISMTGCLFENMACGCYILGENIVVSGNKLVNISNIGLNFGESNYTARRSLSTCVVSDNVFEGLGKSLVPLGGYAFAVTIGINANGMSYAYTDDTQDSGMIIANNSFKDSYADVSTWAIVLKGNVTARGNYCSGLQTNTSSSSIFINVLFGSDSGSYVGVNGSKIRIFLEDNKLEQKLSGYNFNFGINAVSTDNAELYMKGNFIDAATTGGQFTSTTNGFLPFVSLCGDIIMPTCRLLDLAATDAGTGTTRIALSGTNTTNFSSTMSRDTTPTLAASRALTGATPSVALGSLFYTANAGATTVTNLVRAVSSPGEEITIYVNDVNTTFQHNANLVLAGGIDFVAARYATITLYRPCYVSTTQWVEKCRKV